MELLFRIFDSSGFPARWQCGSGWTETPWLGWLHILSDLGVWSAYLAIPIVLVYCLLRRKDLPFRMIFLLFGGLILACGTAHLMEAITFWWPVYGLAGIIKLLTAIISWTTVFALFQVVPSVLAMRGPKEMEREIAARKRAEEELQRVNAELEQRVQQRTADLTQTADALRDERELLRTTLGSIAEGVIVTDTHGRVAFLNRVAEELTGWTKADTRGLPLGKVFAVINEHSRQPVDNMAMRALRGSVIIGLASQNVLLSKDGTERPIEDSAAPIQGSDGAIRGAVLIFRDITEKKRSEQALKDADRRKDEFLATLAHELRNPLAPIRNSLEIMKRSGGNLEMIEQSRLTMERQLCQMVRLVDDLIDVSRISRNKLELRREKIELASVIDHVVEACRPFVDGANHELIVTLPKEPIVLNADPIRLAQVFGNLVTNSCKYSDQGGRIWLTVERLGSEAIITVKDTGIGIPPDRLGHVFEMFAQIDQTLERSQGGLGIGLTLVKRLVEMHDGSVTAQSEGLGRGSEFKVRLPICNVQTTVQPVAATVPENVAPIRRRVLVVDDNRDSATTLALLLKMTGNEVLIAHDGMEAIEKAESFNPDLILLDIGLPKLNGYAACRAIRQQSRGKDVVIVALSGWGQAEDRRKSKEAGFDDHLVKPIDHPTLMKVLAERHQA